MKGQKQNIEILYQDNDLIILNKPAGLLTLPDRFSPDIPNLRKLLINRLDEVFVVHRLDRGTSGVICFAKNERAHQELNRQFEEREVEKIYWAIVQGQPAEGEGVIEQPLAPSPSKKGKMVVSKKGKPSITHYRVLERFGKFSLVEIQIKTGRTHQIRVHFQHIGHSLAVDPIYGKRHQFLLSELKNRNYRLGKNQIEKPLMTRCSLHALKLSVCHPSDGNLLSFEAPLPKDFGAMLQQLRKWGR